MSCEAAAGTTGTHWSSTAAPPTLTLLLLLAVLLMAAGAVSSYPVNPSSTVLLHHHRDHHHHHHHHHPAAGGVRWDWESLLSRSILGLSSSGGASQQQQVLRGGIKRLRRLYCNAGIGFHLEVLPDGRISGTHQENQYSLIEISAVERGVVSLYGVRSERFVAMNRRGRLYATTVFHDECKFRESLLPNNYNAYESWAHRGSYIALSKHGRAKRGNKATTATTTTHFLPRTL